MLKNFYINILLIIVLIVLTNIPVFADVTQLHKESEIAGIIFSGNKYLDRETILESFGTKESPGAISKFFYAVFGEKFGSTAIYLDQEILSEDIERLKQIYFDIGFFNTKIETHLSYHKNSSKVKILINIEENQRSFIDSLEYKGLDELSKSIWDEIIKDKIVKKGNPYIKLKINDEVKRIIDILNNNGYPFAKLLYDSSSVVRYYSTNNFIISYVFDTGVQYRLGDINIHTEPKRADVTENLILRQLEIRKGDLVSKNKLIASEKNLNRLGIFESARIDIQENNLSTTDEIPVDIHLKNRNKHEFAPEIIISDEDNAFNLGFGAGYTNRNFYGGARNFNLRLRLSTQSIHEWNFDRIFNKGGLEDPSISGKAELQFQILQPYIFTKDLNGSWTLSLGYDKKNFYVVSLIKNKIGLVKQFATYTTGLMEWILERSNVNWLEDTLKTGLSLERLKQEEQPQFNSIISFTLQRDKTNDIFSPTGGFFHAVSVEESGSLQEVLKKIQPDLPFTKFYKLTLMGRWYKDLSRTKFNILALKLKSGYQEKYGLSKRDVNARIPLNRRFFAGGSGSVRGWKTRTLGIMPQEELALGGNFLIEGNAELRINHFRGFDKLWFIELQNIWAVYFVDFGNLWRNIDEFQLKNIALASGVGLRYDTFIGPVRFDFGFQVYDPNEKKGNQWFFKKKLFKEVLSSGVLNFGIGHAF